MILALLFAASTQLYLGEIRHEWIDIQLRTDGTRVLGATCRPRERDKPPRLVTGTATGKHLVLHEWSAPGVETAKIDARITKRGLRGTWGGKTFDFWPGGAESPLANERKTAWPAFDRLHDAMLAGRWDEATFYARLACAMVDEGCQWLAALPALSAGQQRLERQSAPCDWAHRMPCLFARDQLPQLPAAERKERARDLCENQLLACAEYWGANAVALSEAARRGDAAAVEKLLQTRPNVNAGGGLLRLPLDNAIDARSLPVVKLLIEHGADPNSIVLDTRVGYAPEEIVLYLLDRGAEPIDGVLWNAVYFGKHAVARKALEKGADVDEEFPAGTPLTAAVDRRDVTMVRELLARCADPDSETNHSEGSPIDHARKMRAKKILALLLAARNANCSWPEW
jgi:hypothetical protein